MTRDELDRLREGWDFEAKLARGRDGRGALPVSLWETYSAMANTAGGLVLLGAKERPDGSLEFMGIPDIDRVERDLWNTLQNPQKVSANLLSQGDVERLHLGGRTLLLLRIPKAPRASRPVYLKGSWAQETFLRVYDGDRRASKEIARRMLADGVIDRDSGAIEEFTTADLHPDSVLGYREFMGARRPDHTFLRKRGDDFLVAIGAAKRIRGEEGVVRPTWAGLYMLGDEVSIRELLPAWHLSYKELPADPDDPRRWVDRVYPDGVWNANLFEFYRRAIVKLHDGLRVPFALAGGQFRVDETPVHDALREALVNTLIHADHQGTTGVRVIRARRGFEFINPGLLLVSEDQIWRGGVSEPRNPALQRLFGFLRLGEREGSGGPTMHAIWRAQRWPAPQVYEDFEHSETHLRFSLESSGHSGETLAPNGGSAASNGGSAASNRGNSAPNGGSAAPNGGSTPPNGGSTPPNGGSTPPNGGSTALALFQISRRATATLADNAILEICAQRFVTADLVAEALGRSAKTVQRYLSRLIRAQRLRLRYPERPQHPQQAYRANEPDKGNS